MNNIFSNSSDYVLFWIKHFALILCASISACFVVGSIFFVVGIILSAHGLSLLPGILVSVLIFTFIAHTYAAPALLVYLPLSALLRKRNPTLRAFILLAALLTTINGFVLAEIGGSMNSLALVPFFVVTGSLTGFFHFSLLRVRQSLPST